MPTTSAPVESPAATTQRSAVGPVPAPSPVPKPVVAFFAGLRKIFGKAEDAREVVHEPPTTVKHRGRWELTISIEADELDGGYVAECLEVPGAMAQGESEEEALENLIDAVKSVVEVKMEQHLHSIDFVSPIKAEARVLTIEL